MKQRVIGIRLNEPVMYFADAKEASEYLGTGESTIYKLIQNGTESLTGWCFDYAIN